MRSYGRQRSSHLTSEDTDVEENRLYDSRKTAAGTLLMGNTIEIGSPGEANCRASEKRPAVTASRGGHAKVQD